VLMTMLHLRLKFFLSRGGGCFGCRGRAENKESFKFY
jgi:hypothetical protein